MTIGAKTPGPSNWVIMRLLKYPSPADAPKYSPIVAAIKAMGIASFIDATRYEIAEGKYK